MFAKTILGRFVLPKSHPSVLLPRRSFLSLVDTVGETQNPLLLDLKQIARAKNLCDENGFRTGKHWTFVISVNSMNTSVDEPPKLKTLNFQRVSNEGIDFVSRKKPNSILSEKPVSFLYTAGQYISGQTIIQWRADGICEKIDLGEVLAHIPEYSITEMVATDRARKENNTSAEVSKSLKCIPKHHISVDLVATIWLHTYFHYSTPLSII